MVSLFSREILELISQNKDYIVAYKVVPYITFSKLLFGIYMIFTVGVTLTNKTKYISYSNIFAAILNIILNFIFIPKFGIIGAALASLISFILRTIILYFHSQKFYYIKYRIIRVITFLLVLLVIGIVQNYYQIHLLLKFILFLLILTATPITGLVKYSQISSFWKMIMVKVKK